MSQSRSGRAAATTVAVGTNLARRITANQLASESRSRGAPATRASSLPPMVRSSSRTRTQSSIEDLEDDVDSTADEEASPGTSADVGAGPLGTATAISGQSPPNPTSNSNSVPSMTLSKTELVAKANAFLRENN
jgi:hypothetical protein